MIDREQVYKWWNIFHNVNDEHDVTEVRVLGEKNYSGYYKNVENVIRDIEHFDNDANEQIYFILNVINPGCYGRKQCECMVPKPKNTTSDNDIPGR